MKKENQTRDNFGAKLGRFVIKWRWFVLVGSLSVAIFMANGLQYAAFNNDYRVFFKPDNPQLMAFDVLEKKYTKDDNVYVVIEPKNGKVFERETLTAIEEFVDSAWQMPYSSRVDALTNYQFTKAEGDDMYVSDLISDAANKSAADFKEAEQRALADPILMHRLINEDASLTGVNIVVKKPELDEYQKMQAEKKRVGDSLGIAITTFVDCQVEIATIVREQIKLLEAKYPNIKTHLSGEVMLGNAFGEAASNDMATLIPAMYGVIILVLFLFVLYNAGLLPGSVGKLKSIMTGISAVFATVVLLMLCIMAGVGFMSGLGMKMTSVSVSGPTMILTLAVADSIHILITLLQGMRSGLSKNEALVESLRINFIPVLITSATTILGFLTMNFSEVPPFHDLGNMVAIGVFMAFFLSVTLLIALLSILPIWVKEKEGATLNSTSLLIRLANFVIGRKKPLLYASLGVTAVLIWFASRNEVNERFVDYFDNSIEFRRATDFMSENLTGIYRIEYSVGAGEEGGINNTEYLNTLQAFEDWFKKNDKVIHVNSYTSIAKKVNKSMHGDDESAYKLPESRDEAAQYLLLYEMSLPFGLDLNNQINVNKSETRFTVTVDNIKSNELIALGDAGTQWLEEHNVKGESNLGVSVNIIFAHLGQGQVNSMAKGGFWAILLIGLALIFALRSFKLGVLSIVPNIIPVAMGFGIWYFLDGYINSGLAAVFSITIGIVVDDTVHLFSKYLRARREYNKSPEEAIKYAFSTVGMAIITTTIVLSSGFFILGQSAFTANSGMAQLAAITIIGAKTGV